MVFNGEEKFSQKVYLQKGCGPMKLITKFREKNGKGMAYISY